MVGSRHWRFADARWAAVLSLALALVAAVAGAVAPTKPRAEVRSVALTVSDLDAAERFFVDTLQFQREGARVQLAGPEFERLIGVPGARAVGTRLRLGREHVELIAYDAPAGRAAPADSRSNDLWFQHLALVTSDIDALQPKLHERAISSGVQTLPRSNPNAGGIRAFYFRGPSAHPLELIWYPSDKGLSRWHERGAPLLGIDHTAIAVSDSRRARAFYTDVLGLSVAGQSFNYGREQEALSAVPNARVRITGLRGAAGLGLEFLEYLSPRDGRPAPSDARASDVWSGEITIAVADLDATLAELRAAGTRVVSDGVRDTRAIVPGTTRGVVVRDPDGHAVRIVQ